MNSRHDLRRLTLPGILVTLIAVTATADELPDKELLSANPKQFFEDIGKAAVQDLPSGATDVDRAKAVVRLLGKDAEKYDLYANVDLKGRFRDVFNQQGNCGYWRGHLKDAFRAAGIARDRIASAESYTYDETGGDDPGVIVNSLKNLDVNNVHTSVLVHPP